MNRYKIILIVFFVFLNLLVFESLAKDEPPFAIIGVTGDILKNIQTQLLIEIKANPNNFRNNTPKIIKKALEPFGYFKAQVQIKKDSANIPSYIIKLGPPLRITRVNLIIRGYLGKNIFFEKFISDFPLKEGDIFEVPKYEKAKEDLFNLVNKQGYIKASLVKKEVRINLKNNTASIILDMETGKQYYFGKVTFKQNVFSSAFLSRFITFNRNEPFSSDKLLEFQQNLSSSRYFKQVVVFPNFNNVNDDKIPIDVETTVPRSQQYKIGVGYGTFTGPRLTAGVDFRRISDDGQHLVIETQLSSILSAFAARYYFPGKNPLTDKYTLGGNVQKFNPKNGSSFSESISGGYSKINKNLQQSINLNVLNERYNLEENPKRTSHLLYPAYTISFVKVDDLLNPSNAISARLSLRGATKTIFSTTNFIQTEIRGKYLFSPTELSHVIIRGNFGYTVVKDLDSLPLSLNFFAGGINTVRGYPLDSLGPGRYLKVISGELQHKIYGNWDGAVFYDMGNAENNFNASLKRGAGFGIIYNSIIGPFRVYLGQALTKEKSHSLEFSLGADFQ